MVVGSSQEEFMKSRFNLEHIKLFKDFFNKYFFPLISNSVYAVHDVVKEAGGVVNSALFSKEFVSGSRLSVLVKSTVENDLSDSLFPSGFHFKILYDHLISSADFPSRFCANNDSGNRAIVGFLESNNFNYSISKNKNAFFKKFSSFEAFASLPFEFATTLKKPYFLSVGFDPYSESGFMPVVYALRDLDMLVSALYGFDNNNHYVDQTVFKQLWPESKKRDSLPKMFNKYSNFTFDDYFARQILDEEIKSSK